MTKKTVRRYGFRRLQPLVFFPLAHFLQGNKMWTLDGNVCCIGAPPNRQIYWLIEFVITTYWIGEWHSLRIIKWKLAKEWVKSVLIKNGSKLQVIFIVFSKIIICILRTIFVKIGVFSSWSKKKKYWKFLYHASEKLSIPL